MNEEKVTIVISGKRYDIDTSDKESIQAMPWKDRKVLIGLLDTIQQAEHIKPQEPAVEPEPTIEPARKLGPQKTAVQIKAHDLNTKPRLDPEIKPSEADIDSMMERFVMEGQKDRPKIPDKSSIYKLLLIIMAVLLGVSLIF
mgnify:CR=1 FL=1